MGAFYKADFKYYNGCFEFQPEYPNKAFFVLNVKFFYFLDETSHIEKFEGTDFKIGNNFFKFQPKNT